MKLLAIETSCDETAAAVVEDGTNILSNVVASQVDIHARYGGIVPEVASRQHLLMIVPLVEEAMQKAGVAWRDLSALPVTIGPGLAGSLLVGVNMAKAISLAHNIPLVGVSHLESHIYANWLEGSNTPRPHSPAPPEFPFICLIVSGGHTDLVLAKGHGQYRLIGRTRDDAAGEAFDKVARILGLGYPGGPVIERVAHQGDASKYPLPRAWLRGSDDFSFSGVKTAVLRLVEQGQIAAPPAGGWPPDAIPQEVIDMAASFQESVADVLVTKTAAAARRHGVKQVLLAGGVAANKALRRAMLSRSPVPIMIPSPHLCTDNAAMVGCCGHFHFISGHTSPLDVDVFPNLGLAA